VAQIVLDRGRGALPWITIASAARIDHAQPRAGWDGGARFRMRTAAVGEHDQGRRAVTAAEQAECGAVAPIRKERELRRRRRADLDLGLLSEPAAEAAGTAGIGAQTFVPNNERRDALERLDAAGADIGGEGGRRQAVAMRGGPHAAGGEQDL